MKKILLLGASGFLGSKLLELAPDNIDLCSSYKEKRLETKKQQVEIDLLDFDNVRQKINGIRPQLVIYAARLHPFDSNRLKAEEVATEFVEIIKAVGSKLIYISSDAVFEGKKGNYKELDETKPLTNYGKAKLASETVIRNSLKDFIIVRPSYIYDDRFNKLDKREFQLLKQIKNVETIYRFKDAFRSPILVTDLARAIWKLADSDFVGIVHVAGERKSIYQFFKELAKKVGLDPKLIKPNLISDENQDIAPDTSLNTDLVDRILK